MSNNSSKLSDLLDTFHQEHWYLTKLLVLLCIIGLTSLGSFSLAPHLLPQASETVGTPSAPNYSDGVCDADPNQIQSKYLPIPSDISTSNVSPTSAHTPAKANTSSSTLTSTSTPTVPDSWYSYGFTNNDAKYAQACAAQFVLTYHTFDYRKPESLEAAVPMLSGHAKKLFYLGGAEDTHNIHLHMLGTWRDTIQQFQQSQQATVEQPTLKHITPQYSNYIVEVDVGYKLIKEKNSEVQLPEIHHDVVILQNTHPSPKLLPNQQHGWVVEDWIDADV